MKVTTVHLEPYRIEDRLCGIGSGMNGLFLIPGVHGRRLACRSSHGEGWEHVSVSLPDHRGKIPTWTEMHHAKRQFWDDEETVVQIHPPEQDYVHERIPGVEVLHLWRKIDGEHPLPPQDFV